MWPSVVRLLAPRLKLYTGGPLCSLCTDLHHALGQLQPAFELETYDIRPSDADSPAQALARKAWRRKYKYDVPVLHLVKPHLLPSSSPAATAYDRSNLKPDMEEEEEVEVLRHRINVPKLLQALKEEQARLDGQQ